MQTETKTKSWDEILLSFCHKDDKKANLPARIGDFVFATNRTKIIKIPVGLLSGTYQEREFYDVEKILKSYEKYQEAIDKVKIERWLERCTKYTTYADCEECEGNRYTHCPHCDHKQKCHECKGTGQSSIESGVSSDDVCEWDGIYLSYEHMADLNTIYQKCYQIQWVKKGLYPTPNVFKADNGVEIVFVTLKVQEHGKGI